MATAPNRDARLIISLALTRADPQDTPMALSELDHWEIEKAPGSSNTWTPVATNVPVGQLTYDILDLSPGSWQIRFREVDKLGQPSGWRVTGVSVPMPAAPAIPNLVSLNLL